MRRPRDSLAVAGVFAFGIAALLVNLDQPLVRNSLVYARAAEHVLANGGNPLPVVADSLLSYDKPMGFAWSSAPLVAAFGTHLGLMLASALGVLALLAATAQLLRTVRPGPEHETLRARALLFGTLSPLVVYQTWSAHPDALEAALQLAALTQALRLVNEPDVAPRRRALWLFLLLEGGVLLKNYGLVMLVVLPLVLGLLAVRTWRTGGRVAITGMVLAWLTVAGLAALAFADLNPLARVAGEGGGAGQYGRGELLASASGCLVALALALGLSVQVALPFTVRGLTRVNGAWALLGFAAIHTAGLLPFANAYYNLRYFLPVLPIAGLLAAAGLDRAPRALQHAATITFVAFAVATITVFNFAPAYEVVQPSLPAWRWRGDTMPSLWDNLRLPLHLEQRRWLADLAAATPPGATVFLVDFTYYRDAQHGVYERAGKIRSDLTTRYVTRRGLQANAREATEREFWVCFGHSPDEALLERFGEVTEPRPGIFRVRRA
jgi:hypothetical protein